MGVGMSWEMKSAWEVMAGLTGAAILMLTAYVEFIGPIIRKRKLRNPCKASFFIRELQKGRLDYFLQDDRAHSVKELVIPSDSVVEIEISYYPIIAFHVYETVFSLEGEAESKPEIVEALAPFVAKGEIVLPPPYWDRHGNYHYRSLSFGRSMGSCYTKGFKLRTRKPGIYKASLGFITDERDGSADLQIMVEEKPSIKMRCIDHKDCYVYPLGHVK